MRLVIVVLLSVLASGCTLERVQQDSAQVLGTLHVAQQLSIERSSRWRIDDPGFLTMAAEYDPADPQQVALLDAAFAGVNRVYPQTVLDRAPTASGALPDVFEPVAMLIRVDIPSSSGGGTTRFPVAVIDVRTGSVIDRAMLTLRPSAWGAANAPSDVAQLFSDYAAELRPAQ
jgi:hypothetical protein